jgi:predicted phosphodiesterase
MTYKTIITLPDYHDPFGIRLTPVLKFISDIKPDIIQLLGDNTNAESCDHWKITKGIRPLVDDVMTDYKNLRKNLLNPLKKASPKSKMVFFIGNHEKWFYDAMDMDPRCRGKYDIESNIDTKHFNMEVIPFNSVKQYGYLHYMHGIYVNKYHASNTASNYRKCIIYGHTHDIQSHMIYSPIDTAEKILAKSIGCMCNLNPMYLRSKPNKWVHAFHIAYIRSDGTFNDYTIVITRGRFIAPNGKLYR